MLKPILGRLALASGFFLLAPASSFGVPLTLVSVNTSPSQTSLPGEIARTESPLIVAEMMVGSVIVVNTATQLSVTYSTFTGWDIRETHLDIQTSLAAIPQTSAHAPIVSNFAFHKTTPGTTRVEFIFNLGPEVGTGTPLFVAANAKVQREVECAGDHEGDVRPECDHHEGRGKPCDGHERKCDHHEGRGRPCDRHEERENPPFKCDHHEGYGKPCDRHENMVVKCDDDGRDDGDDNGHQGDHRNNGCDHHEGRGKACDHRERHGKGCDGHEGRNRPCDNHESNHGGHDDGGDDDGGMCTPGKCVQIESGWAGDHLFQNGKTPAYFVHTVVLDDCGTNPTGPGCPS